MAIIMTCGCIQSNSLTIGISDTSSIESDCVQFTNNTGISCNIISDINSSDIIIADLKDLPELVKSQKIISLNSYLKNGTTVNYSTIEWPILTLFGEYPKGSGEIYALPFSPDSSAIIIRSDGYENKTCQEFLKRYGTELGTPITWTELINMAELWNSTIDNRYGIATLSSDSEQNSPLFTSMLSSYNMKKDAKVLSELNRLRNFTDSNYISTNDLANALIENRTSMIITSISSFDECNEEFLKNNVSVIYRALPGALDSEGKTNRSIATTGKIIAISNSTLSDTVKLENAKNFLTWFFDAQQQFSLSKSKRLPVISSVLDSPEWRGINEWNSIIAESLRMGIRM